MKPPVCETKQSAQNRFCHGRPAFLEQIKEIKSKTSNRDFDFFFFFLVLRWFDFQLRILLASVMISRLAELDVKKKTPSSVKSGRTAGAGSRASAYRGKNQQKRQIYRLLCSRKAKFWSARLLWLSFVVVAFSSFARISGERSIIHSPPALFFFFFLN